MKQFLTLTAILLYTSTCLSAPFLTAEAFVGNKPGCLDYIDVSELNGGDRAFVETPEGLYLYRFDYDSVLKENVPDVIQSKGDDSKGRWILYRAYTKDSKKKSAAKRTFKNMDRHKGRWVSNSQREGVKRK